MIRFAFLLPLTLGLSACDGMTPIDAPTKADAPATPLGKERASPDDRVSCALGGATIFTDRCSVETRTDEIGLVLIIRHPDGGFRRLRVTTDGTGLMVADGAEKAKIRLIESQDDDGKSAAGRQIEVSVADERYILRATIQPKAANR